MKQRNYVAPSISERASRIRTSILAGSSNEHIHIKDMDGWDEGTNNARVRTATNVKNPVFNF